MENQSNEYGPGELMDKEQAASYLRVSVAWFSSPYRRKVLPDGLRMGKKKYWAKTDLDNYVARQRQELLKQFEAQQSPVPKPPAAIVSSGATLPDPPEPKKRGPKPKAPPAAQAAPAAPDALTTAETELQAALNVVRKLLYERSKDRATPPPDDKKTR